MRTPRTPRCRNARFLLAAAGVWGSLVACAADPQGGDGARPDPALAEQAVVYGDDDRVEVYAHPEERWRALAREAIVALVPSSALDRGDGAQVRIAEGVPTLGEARQLCEDQRFRDQPTAANCSGTLIDHDLVLTAGHCVPNVGSCGSDLFVFDYYYGAEGELATIDPEDVYTCASVVARRLSGGFDYAVVQLDRPVVGREPAPVRRGAEAMAEGAPVTVIGFGSGLPAKIDDGGEVLYPHADLLDYFEATTDTFGGNSGSGVFNEAGEVVGILVRGETDYVSRGSCRVVNVVDAGGDGPGDNEEITYAFRAIDDLCDEVGWPSARLCADDFGDGWCDACVGAGECPDGWACVTSAASGGVDGATSYCAPSCDAVGGCLLGHSCGADGRCHPNASARCSAGDVWRFDTCGRRLGVLEACREDGLRCIDGGCVERPAGDTCEDALRIEATSQVLRGELDRAWDDTEQGSCAGAGAEVVYTFAVAEPTLFEAEARSADLDPVLYLRRDTCTNPSAELACNDDVDYPNDLGSAISATLEVGSYYLVMDTYEVDTGAFELALTLSPVEVEAVGETCAEPTRIAAVDQRLTGSLAEYSAEYVGSCGGGGVERVFSFTLDEPTALAARASGFDTVLYLRSDCGVADTERACHDDIDPGVDQRSVLEVELEPGDWHLFLDTWGEDPGEYVLDLTFDVVPCASECTPGERRCDGNQQVAECVPDERGCGSWLRASDCGDDAFCRDGSCVAICEDECGPVGTGLCAGDTALTCGEFDGDPCAEWGAERDCGPDGRCERGRCSPLDPGGDLGVDFDFPGLDLPDEDAGGGGSLYVAPSDRPPRGDASCGCAVSTAAPTRGRSPWSVFAAFAAAIGLAQRRRRGLSSGA
jgi:hypothetical protein